MKRKKAFLIIALLAIVCTLFTTCENPIIEKWWQDPEPEYIVLEKLVPTYIEIEVPGKGTNEFQKIKVIAVEYIIFAGDQIYYNQGHGPNASTDLTPEEIKSNNLIIQKMATLLASKNDYKLILHGHANPTSTDEAEIQDLIRISTGRAKSVNVQLWEQSNPRDIISGYISDGKTVDEYIKDLTSAEDGAIYITDPKWMEKVISVDGYGGENNLVGGTDASLSLNRRVEVIIVEILTYTKP